jgi:hypothetical protein
VHWNQAFAEPKGQMGVKAIPILETVQNQYFKVNPATQNGRRNVG